MRQHCLEIPFGTVCQRTYLLFIYLKLFATCFERGKVDAISLLMNSHCRVTFNSQTVRTEFGKILLHHPRSHSEDKFSDIRVSSVLCLVLMFAFQILFKVLEFLTFRSFLICVWPLWFLSSKRPASSNKKVIFKRICLYLYIIIV